MDKTGASKGFVLVISLGDFSTDYLEDKDGNTINSTTVSGFEGYFKTQNNGKYNITVTGKNREGTKRKIV